MRFSTGRKFGDAGFIHRRGRRLLKVTKCPIADPWVNAVLPRLQGHARGLHQIQLRRNAATGSTLVAPALEVLPEESGQEHYVEELAGRRFRVSASSFFQVNSAQAEKLVQLVASELPQQGRLLIDAYAGVGTFAAIFAERFERIIAIEESPSALRDAEVNLDGIENVEFRRAKVEELLPGLDEEPDVVLLDPPRVGCAPEVLEALVGFAPPTIVYVSCNPTTLAPRPPPADRCRLPGRARHAHRHVSPDRPHRVRLAPDASSGLACPRSSSLRLPRHAAASS